MADIKLLFEILKGKNNVSPELDDIRKQAGKAEGSIGKIGKSFNNIDKGVSGLGKNVGSIIKSFNVLGGVIAIAGAAFSVNKIIQAANEQEDAVIKLNIALAQSGLEVSKVSKRFQDFASELQRTTKFGDEVILQNAAILQSLGQLDEQGLQKGTQAALDLSAALGIDLNAAFLLVGKAAAGEVSTFSRYGLIIRKGADETETFNNALTAINRQFGGAAQKQVGTFSGAMSQLSNSFGDLLEQLGFIVTKNPAVIKGIKELSNLFSNLAETLARNSTEIISFINGFTEVLQNTKPIRASILAISLAFNELSRNIKSTIRDIEGIILRGIPDAVIQATPRLKSLQESFNSLSKDIEDSDKVAKKLFDDLTNLSNVKDLKIKKVTIEDPTLNLKPVIKKTELELIEADINAGVTVDSKKLNDLFLKSGKVLGDSIIKVFDTSKLTGDESTFGKIINNINDLAPQINRAIQGIVLVIRGNTDKLFQNFVSGLTQGAQGANKIASALTGQVATAISGSPEIGQAVQQLTQLLTLGPEAVRAQIQAFTEQIPVLLENIIISLPVLVEALATGLADALVVLSEKIDIIVEKFVAGLVSAVPRIIGALIVKIPLVIRELQLRMPFVAITFASELIKSVPTIVSEFVKEIKNQLKSAGGLIGGGGGGPLGGIGKVFGFQTGGKIAGIREVPAGFPRDAALAGLSTGEFVVRSDLTGKLERFLSNPVAAGADDVSIGLLAQISDALQRPVQVQGQIMTLDNRVLADQLLTISRGNLRTG